MSDDEASEIVLITGAATRIGAEFARALAMAGYKIVIHYASSKDAAQNLAAEIKAEGADAAIVQADLTKRAQRSKLIEKAAKPFGPITTLINNASVYQKDSAKDVDETLWDTHFALHAEAPVFLARDFAAQLPKGTQGNIINIVDERVLSPSPAAFSYHLSKSTLWSATQTLAQSLAPTIRVNAIGPGAVLPEAGQSQATFDKRGTKTLLKQNADPSDLVEALFYLLNAKSVTGQFIAVDGGEHLLWPERRGVTPKAT